MRHIFGDILFLNGLLFVCIFRSSLLCSCQLCRWFSICSRIYCLFLLHNFFSNLFPQLL